MWATVADTGPLNYLALIGKSSLLAALFDTVYVPEAVCAELNHSETPAPVRQWFASAPAWLVRRPDPVENPPDLQALGIGERAAIMLVYAETADLLLMDDRAGVAVARQRGLAVTGTVGLLDLAARRGLLDLEQAFARLRATSFRCRPELLDAVLARHRS